MNDTKLMIVKNGLKEKTFTMRPTQSANTLFHFMEKLEYLLPILEREAVVPRYCVESVDYLKITYKSIAYPMLCFCDINLHKIENHTSFYGEYGIGFSKEWGIRKGIQPIQYINDQSHLCKDFSEAFNTSLNSLYTDEAQSFLLSQMFYLKPIEGDMIRNEEDVHKNFTDECEWRFIPEAISPDLPVVLMDSEIIQKETFDKALLYEKEAWLKFSIEDIKYLIIRNRDDFDKILDIILKKSKLDLVDKHKLTSKIIVLDEAREDF